jgi:hypothetical protein
MFADINCTGNFTVGGVTQQTTGSRDVTQSMFTNMKAHGDIDLGDLSQS